MKQKLRLIKYESTSDSCFSRVTTLLENYHFMITYVACHRYSVLTQTSVSWVYFGLQLIPWTREPHQSIFHTFQLSRWSPMCVQHANTNLNLANCMCSSWTDLYPLLLILGVHETCFSFWNVVCCFGSL